MKFGIDLAPVISPDEKSAADYYEEALRLAVLAEELGYGHVRTVEHYFTYYGGYSPDPVAFLSAVAARTERIKLVTGAVLPVFSHPVQLAGKLAMLDNISKGRLEVGFGRAFLPAEFEAFNVPIDESHERFREGIEACRRLWAEEDVVWNGTFHSFGPVTLLPRPYQQPHPPVLVATARTPESCVAAGEAGFGLMMVPGINSAEQTQHMLSLYRQAWADAGHEPGGENVHMSYNVYIDEDGEEAYRRGRHYDARVGAKLAHAVADWKTTRSSAYRGYEQLAQAHEGGDPFDEHIRDNKVLVGTPEHIRGQLAAVRDLYGDDLTVSFLVSSGDMPVEDSVRAMRLLAEQVVPHLS
ncbi:LLM class flavin-dependent oxidoreductase [Streptomyces sp. MP131-18]|uniref:LLM class flavin-dependent oxidoreductase n=1 Tax=Streptomyces sp. MP131-18 TaxID=1857892 RepID=UPI00097BD0EC|nr:LLM class flavin-dependent oxidoreductase [Streptomyces sp. MP131-18]ONK14141.1 Alkanal monooxygenase alpha chain [Streptomyces sp. MP131-18]